MKRMNFWQGQRITWQELKKNIKDTEKAIEAVGAAFARKFNQPSATTKYFYDDPWGLPTISATSAFEDGVTITLCGGSGLTSYPLDVSIDEYLYTSGNIIISDPMYVYFKSGRIVYFEATTPAGLDFVLSGVDDIIPFINTGTNIYTATVGFIGDHHFNLSDPTGTSADPSFLNLLNISADNPTTFKSDGYVSNTNSEFIRNYLVPIIPSAQLSAFIGNCWTSGEGFGDGDHPKSYWGPNFAVWPVRKYWPITKATDMEFNTRSSVPELIDYSDTAKETLDYYNDFCPIAAKITVYLDEFNDQQLSGGTSPEWLASGHLSGIILNATMFGADDSIFEDPAGRHDLRGYIQFLKEWSSGYPHFEYTSALSDDMTYWSRTTSGTEMGKLSAYTHYTTQPANSVTSLGATYMGSGTLSATNTDPAFDTPNFYVDHNFTSHVFGAYFKDLDESVRVYRIKEASAATGTAGLIQYRYDVAAATGTMEEEFGGANRFDKPNDDGVGGYTAHDATTIPRNNACLISSGALIISYYGGGLTISGAETDYTDESVYLIYYPVDSDYDYNGNTTAWPGSYNALQGHSQFWSSAFNYMYHGGYGPIATGDYEDVSAWQFPELSGDELQVWSRSWPSATGPTVSPNIIAGVTGSQLPNPGDDLSPSILRADKIAYIGIDAHAYENGGQAEFSQEYSRKGYTNLTGYVSFFENTSRYETPQKLAVVNYPSGSTQLTNMSAHVDSWWLYDPKIQTWTSASLSFMYPTTGTSATSGWYCNIVPLEAPEDTDGWWCVALENNTQRFHLYRIAIPKQLYGWST